MLRLGAIALAMIVLAAGWLEVGAPGNALADDANTIPGEFGGVRMGAFMSDLEGMVFTRSVRVEDEIGGDYEVRFHTCKGAPRELAGVRLERVEYGFCEDYLCVVRAEAAGIGAYEALVREYAGIYGTEDRRVFLYGSFWDRFCDEERTAEGRSTRWILCEHETDNCAVFSINYLRERDRTVLLLGDQYAGP